MGNTSCTATTYFIHGARIRSAADKRLDAEANPDSFCLSHGLYNRPMEEFVLTRSVELAYWPE